ncbi:hypothetical protein MACH10_15910 [Thalassospira tepidiphila]|nr:hypothetical protein MACH10_15910 [Thalassospira tepidiphila]
MKQTWATNDKEDYTLLSLLNEPIRLAANKYWKLTPNAVAVSSVVSAASAETGVKTLTFFQSIKNAASAARHVSELLEPVAIKLNTDETKWLDIASLEMGSSSYLYLETNDGIVVKASTVHHGLLLPEERLLCESLYKRPDGIKVLTATSTLAQGMNLPSELVIIGEDSRFDQAKNKRKILEAQELLNAAGRAGRAGESASGVVLVVPGQVVGIDFEAATVGAHWSDLRAIFEQSDQCLEIDDPLTAILDRIHSEIDTAGEIERYAVLRLVACGRGKTEPESLSNAIKSSFGAYLAKKRDNSDWLQERIESAVTFFSGQSTETENELIENQIASSLGLSIELVSRLSLALQNNGPGSLARIPTWRRWIFRWLADNPDLIELVFRRQSLSDLLGQSTYEALASTTDKANFALPIIKRLTWLWMRGKPLCELEKALGTNPDKLKTCDRARKFALRIVPEISYLFGLPALLHEATQIHEKNPDPLPTALSQLGRCVRLGMNSHEKVALYQTMREHQLSRRQIHRYFNQIKSHLSSATSAETWDQVIARVQAAQADELNSRGLDS